MGIPQLSLKEFLEVPVRLDTALDMTDKEYDIFLETCDHSLLKCKEGQTPIFFKIRKVLPYRLAIKLENMKMEIVKKKDGDKVTSEMMPKMGWILEEVKYSIVDIINPDNCPLNERLEFKADSDGLCSDEIMAGLISTNSHMDLWAARNSAGKKEEKPNKKK